ncbi:MAG TPA: hypothetical protein VEK79_00340 [Thermoanaerobaculia bacterium]|nr:hypothetical protein [Thermoanaerobaculia bacterium]
MRTKRLEGNMVTGKNDETRMAEEIVSILPSGVAREFSSERDAIRYAVRADGMKLRTIVLKRASLRKLIEDPQRAVKVEYLQRDLLNAASQRKVFQYPRPLMHFVRKQFTFPAQAAFAR